MELKGNVSNNLHAWRKLNSVYGSPPSSSGNSGDMAAWSSELIKGHRGLR